MIQKLYMTEPRINRINNCLDDLSNLSDSRPILEFGVANGYSISKIMEKLLLNKMTNFLIGFDTFEGLPETDGPWKKGEFSHDFNEVVENLNKQIPNHNIELIKGNFSNTLEPFLKEKKQIFNNGVALVHIDSDLYSSCKIVLKNLKPYFKNTVLIFDEWSGGEDRAWQEFVEKNSKISFKDIGLLYNQKILKINNL